MAKRICKNCGLRFEPKRSDQVFCKTLCRVNYHNGLKRELRRTEWHSPAEIVEAARTVMGGIDLDPASCARANEIVKAEKFYSVREDGLKQPWFGRVWLNPPYGRFAPWFVKRFGDLFEEGSIEQGILLLATHHLTTEWIGELFCYDPIICLPTKRLQFSDSQSRPAHGSVILGVGVDKDQFRKIFFEFGHLLKWTIEYRLNHP